MSDLALPMVILLLGVAGLVGSYFVVRHNHRKGRRSIWSYVLLWPLLLERSGRGSGSLLSKREIIGWCLLLGLIAVAVFFDL
jgi:predicted MFS family arabinose efflux permease